MLWRKSAEPRLAIDVAALIIAAFWSPLFFVTAILPGSSAWAGPVGAEPRIGEMIFLPNLAVAAMFLIAAAAAWRIGRIASR